MSRPRASGTALFRQAVTGNDTEQEILLQELVMASLTKPLKEYYAAFKKGEKDYDPFLMQNILMRFVTFYTIEAISWAWAGKQIPMELSKLMSEVRQGNATIEDMKRKRTIDEEKKNDNETGMVAPTSESLQSRFEALVGKYSTNG